MKAGNALAEGFGFAASSAAYSSRMRTNDDPRGSAMDPSNHELGPSDSKPRRQAAWSSVARQRPRLAPSAVNDRGPGSHEGLSADSYSTCYVMVADVDRLCANFRACLEQSIGRIPTCGLPRIGAIGDMSYSVRQFLLTDPGVQLSAGSAAA